MDSSCLGYGYGYENSALLSIEQMEAEITYMPRPLPVPSNRSMPLDVPSTGPVNVPRTLDVPSTRHLPVPGPLDIVPRTLQFPPAALQEPMAQIIPPPTLSCPQPLDLDNDDRSRGSVILEDLMTNGIPSQQKQLHSNNYLNNNNNNNNRSNNNNHNNNNNRKRVWQGCHVAGSGGSSREMTWAGPTLLDIQSALALKKKSLFFINNNNNNIIDHNNSFGGKSDGLNSSEMWKKLHKRAPVEPKYTLKFKCESEALDDGYRWRKYGQKSIKNNPHPRSYYRCTHPKCPVKKQVERTLQEEMVVTIEGIHLHHRPNPIKTISMQPTPLPTMLTPSLTSMSMLTPSPTLTPPKPTPLANVEFPPMVTRTMSRKPLDFLVNPLASLQSEGLLQDIIPIGLRNMNKLLPS